MNKARIRAGFKSVTCHKTVPEWPECISLAAKGEDPATNCKDTNCGESFGIKTNSN